MKKVKGKKSFWGLVQQSNAYMVSSMKKTTMVYAYELEIGESLYCWYPIY